VGVTCSLNRHANSVSVTSSGLTAFFPFVLLVAAAGCLAAAITDGDFRRGTMEGPERAARALVREVWGVFPGVVIVLVSSTNGLALTLDLLLASPFFVATGDTSSESAVNPSMSEVMSWTDNASRKHSGNMVSRG
jgi:hypothetical protein